MYRDVLNEKKGARIISNDATLNPLQSNQLAMTLCKFTL
jgi:hypothetical protein